MKDKEKMVKVKGYIGIFLGLVLLIFGKISYMFEISLEVRYYTVYIFLFLGAFCIWLSSDLLELWFNHKGKRK